MLGLRLKNNTRILDNPKGNHNMENPITAEEVSSVFEEIKTAMAEYNIDGTVIAKTEIKVIHPKYWELSIFVPTKIDGLKISLKELKSKMDKILFKYCKINKEDCDYLGSLNKRGYAEWYFRHPRTPEEICNMIEAEMEESLGDKIGLGIPCPIGIKSKNNTAFLTLKNEFFETIKSGEKTIEYRYCNQYYCDKLLSPGVQKEYVKFNRGYLAGEENQMIFEIAEIVFISESGDEYPVRDEHGVLVQSYRQLPKHFVPVYYGIKLGKRIK